MDAIAYDAMLSTLEKAGQGKCGATMFAVGCSTPSKHAVNNPVDTWDIHVTCLHMWAS